MDKLELFENNLLTKCSFVEIIDVYLLDCLNLCWIANFFS